MLKHSYIKMLFAVLFAATVIAGIWYYIPWWIYVLIPVVFLAITFTGSYFIQWNYFFTSLNHGNRNGNKIAVTFDDAPLNPQTLQVLDILKKHNVKAAFFLIGKQIEGNEHIIKRIVDEGHIVGNHSYSHVNYFPVFSIASMKDDVEKCSTRIARVIGKKPQLFRPPFGVTNPRVAATVKDLNYISIGWSVRSYDTSINDKNVVLNRCLKNLKGGDIVLFHDWGKHTLDILPQWIAAARQKGLELVRVDELLDVPAYR